MVQWTAPGSARCETVAVTVQVKDTFGNAVTESYTITVVAGCMPNLLAANHLEGHSRGVSTTGGLRLSRDGRRR